MCANFCTKFAGNELDNVIKSCANWYIGVYIFKTLINRFSLKIICLFLLFQQYILMHS